MEKQSVLAHFFSGGDSAGHQHGCLDFKLSPRTAGSRARSIAEQVVSLVTITRAALVHSEPESRRELLFDLASNEGIRIYPLEPTDQIEPITRGDDLMQNMLPYIQQKMGDDTILSPNVNDMPGFWISFKLEEDDIYWLRLDNGRVQGYFRPALAGLERYCAGVVPVGSGIHLKIAE